MSSITFDNTSDLSINPETVSSVPGYLNDEVPGDTIEEKSEPLI